MLLFSLSVALVVGELYVISSECLKATNKINVCKFLPLCLPSNLIDVDLFTNIENHIKVNLKTHQLLSEKFQ